MINQQSQLKKPTNQTNKINYKTIKKPRENFLHVFIGSECYWVILSTEEKITAITPLSILSIWILSIGKNPILLSSRTDEVSVHSSFSIQDWIWYTRTRRFQLSFFRVWRTHMVMFHYSSSDSWRSLVSTLTLTFTKLVEAQLILRPLSPCSIRLKAILAEGSQGSQEESEM